MIKNLGKSWRLKQFRLEVGLYQIAYRGWPTRNNLPIKKSKPIMIGSTKLYSVGPFAVFKSKEKN